MAAINQKSKAFRSIMDLSFLLKRVPQGCIPSVNEKNENTDPGGVIDHIEHELLLLIHKFSDAPEGANIFQEKWDIKDGFWRLDFKEGE